MIGIISDTHGLMRPEAMDALQGSNLILHAGDVGNPEILDQLRAIAPVVAVRGNVDHGDWAMKLPMTAVAEAAHALIYILHNIQDLDIDPAAAGFQMVVAGHSHKPARTDRNGVIYLNPGSAGPRRFKLPITLARLDPTKSPWHIEFVDLESNSPRRRGDAE